MGLYFGLIVLRIANAINCAPRFLKVQYIAQFLNVRLSIVSEPSIFHSGTDTRINTDSRKRLTMIAIVHDSTGIDAEWL